jgi:hypothetical protein
MDNENQQPNPTIEQQIADAHAKIDGLGGEIAELRDKMASHESTVAATNQSNTSLLELLDRHGIRPQPPEPEPAAEPVEAAPEPAVPVAANTGKAAAK